MDDTYHGMVVGIC